MIKKRNVDIKLTQEKNNEYIIKDKYGINLGRIFIIELNKENRYCSFRIKFYRNDESYKEELKSGLELIINSLFKNMNLYKISIIIDEDMIISPFIELGFILEGIIGDTVINNNVHKNEFIFGINKDIFESGNSINVFRLKGKNVELKVLTPEDSQSLCEYYKKNKEHLQNFEPLRDDEFYTIEGQREVLIEGYKQFLNGTSCNFGIYINKRLIGKIQLSNIVRGIFQNAFVGYSIDEEEQGKGYMQEGLKLLLDYAFEDMQLHRIEAATLIDNERSQNVLKICEFKDNGVSKDYLYIDGKWRDHKIFYKIKE